MNEIIKESGVCHDAASFSAHYEADQEKRGMPQRFIQARDSMEAYAKPAEKPLTTLNKIVLIRHHLDKALRQGVPPQVMTELVKALRLIEEIS